MTIKTINPATGELLATYEEMAPAAVNAIIGEAHAAFLNWRRVAYAVRAGPMRKAAEILGVSLKTLYNRLETYNRRDAGSGRLPSSAKDEEPDTDRDSLR